jgi:hypothetical protein
MSQALDILPLLMNLVERMSLERRKKSKNFNAIKK